MYASTIERQAGAEGLGDIGQDSAKGRGGHQSDGDVLQGGGTGGAIVRIGVLSTVDINGENGGRDTNRVPETNYGNHERRRTDGTWVAPATEEVWERQGHSWRQPTFAVDRDGGSMGGSAPDI